MVDAKTEAEIMRQICNTDWRSTRPSLIDRFKCVCLSEEYSDVDFVFNKGLSGEVVRIFLSPSRNYIINRHSFRKFQPIV